MKKMLTTILTRLFGNEIWSRKTEEKKDGKQVVVNVNVKPVEPEKKRYDDPDLNILAEKYGELVAGKEITIELGAAAKMLGRKRVRLDAFAALTKKLKNDYGVELKIYSRRTKV
jgi:hypothetical protein